MVDEKVKVIAAKRFAKPFSERFRRRWRCVTRRDAARRRKLNKIDRRRSTFRPNTVLAQCQHHAGTIQGHDWRTSCADFRYRRGFLRSARSAARSCVVCPTPRSACRLCAFYGCRRRTRDAIAWRAASRPANSIAVSSADGKHRADRIRLAQIRTALRAEWWLRGQE